MHFKLSEADYDFSDVALGLELEACFYYEFARESRAAVGEIDSARNRMKARTGKSGQVNFSSHVQNLIQSHILMSLSITSGFPRTPWRSLSDKDRKILAKMIVSLPHISRYALTWHNPPLSFTLNEPGTTTLDMWKLKIQEGRPRLPDNEPIKFGFFAVNMKYGHSVLIEEFRKYLRHFEGKPMLETPPFEKKTVKTKPPGRKSIHDALNALGAMRLRYHCDTFSEAKKKMLVLKDKPHGVFYARRDSFNRACNSALRHFEKLFGWLDPTERPIHFTEGWRGTPK